MHILVADDDLPSVKLTSFLLEEAGYRVLKAYDGPTILQSVEQNQPDLILLDVSMPIMGGFPAARLLSVHMPKLPIIFVTQHTEQIYVDEAFRCGAKGYVIKRAAMTELPTAIRTVMTGQTFCSPLIQF